MLKQNYKNLFSPPLPIYKENAIEGLSIGTVNKILLKFPFRWWPVDCKGFSFVWTEHDCATILSQYSNGPCKNGRSWLQDIFGFYTIDSHPEILLGWVVGEFVEEMELLLEDIITDGCMFLLKKFLGDTYHIPYAQNCLWYKLKTVFCVII